MRCAVRGTRSALSPAPCAFHNHVSFTLTFTTAPANGVIVRAGFEFDVPVRFDSDTLDVTLDFERLGSITAIPLLEIRR